MNKEKIDVKPKTSGPISGIAPDESHSSSVQIPASGIGARISFLSKKIGTREKASKMIGVSTPQLQRYIREESSAPFDVMARLCAIAGASMEWLVTGEGQSCQQTAQNQSHDSGADQSSIRSPGMLRLPKVGENTPLWFALEAINKARNDKNIRLTTDQMNEIIRLAIELASNGLPNEKVFPIIERIIELIEMPRAPSLSEMARTLGGPRL